MISDILKPEAWERERNGVGPFNLIIKKNHLLVIVFVATMTLISWQCDLEDYPYDERKLNQFCQEHGFIGWYVYYPFFVVMVT